MGDNAQDAGRRNPGGTPMSGGITDVSIAYVSHVARAVRDLEAIPHPVDEARRDLHRAIREAHQAGHSMRVIAEAAGISHQRVAQLLQKEEK